MERFKLYVHVERWYGDDPSNDEPEGAEPVPVELPNNTEGDFFDDLDSAVKAQKELAGYFLAKGKTNKGG